MSLRLLYGLVVGVAVSVFRVRVVQDYNFREYAKRRICTEFREAKALAPDAAQQRMAAAQPELEKLRRMTTVNGLFSSTKSVMETMRRR